MSSGLMSMARLDGSALALAAVLSGLLNWIELSTGTPSTTISGWPSEAVMVVGPRIWIWDDAPGSPEADVTFTFGALAASAFTTLYSLLRWIAVESTVLRPVPSFSTSDTVPAPVTTISPSWSGFSASLKSRFTVPAVSVRRATEGLKPTARTDTVTGPAGTRAPGMASV